MWHKCRMFWLPTNKTSPIRAGGYPLIASFHTLLTKLHLPIYPVYPWWDGCGKLWWWSRVGVGGGGVIVTVDTMHMDSRNCSVFHTGVTRVTTAFKQMRPNASEGDPMGPCDRVVWFVILGTLIMAVVCFCMSCTSRLLLSPASEVWALRLGLGWGGAQHYLSVYGRTTGVSVTRVTRHMRWSHQSSDESAPATILLDDLVLCEAWGH